MLSTSEHVNAFQQVGPHRIHVELPDILFAQLNGDVEPEHFDVFTSVLAQFPPSIMVYILRDGRNGGTVAQRARKYIARNIKTGRVAGVVTFGGTFHARTVLTMMNKAMRLINKQVPPLVFFDTEAEARAWIDVDRKNSRQRP